MSDVSSNASSAPDLVEDENEALQNAALGELGDLELEYDKVEVEICTDFPLSLVSSKSFRMTTRNLSIIHANCRGLIKQ